MGPKNHPKTITDFDAVTIGDNTKMLKILLPFLPPEEQKMIGIMIRVIEFNLTVDYYKNNIEKLSQRKCGDIYDILREMGNYMSKEEKDNLEMMINMMKMKKATGSGNMSDIMSSIMSRDQYNKFKQFEDLL